VRFESFEAQGRMVVCYEGDAFRRLLASPARPDQRADAILALTRPDCVAPALSASERAMLNERHAEVLDEVDTRALPAYLRNRVLIRRASVWSVIAYQQARAGAAPEAAAARAVRALAGITRAELSDEDAPLYTDAAIRVNATRWASTPVAPATHGPGLAIVTQPGQAGETCVILVDLGHEPARSLARRCTYGIVWAASATVNREGSAAAIAVQHMDAWRELWILRDTGRGWTVRIVLPALVAPGVGYAEFAGWVPGGRQVLIARETRSEGVYQRAFEVLRLDTLRVERRAVDPAALEAFRRWQDPAWKGQTVALR